MPVPSGGSAATSTATTSTSGATSTPSTTQQVRPATVQRASARPATVARSVSFSERHLYPDGLQVEVSHIQRTKLKKAIKAKKLKKGAAIEILSVRVTNRTVARVTAATATGDMTYGKKHKTAPAVPGNGHNGMTGTIAPGKSQTGTFAYAVPEKSINDAVLSFSFDFTHQPALFTGSLDYTPGEDTVFNDVRGSSGDQLAIVHYIEKSIDTAPKGSTIRIAQYAFDVSSAATKLIAAHKRGVNVQMIVDRHKPFMAQPGEDYNTSHETHRLEREVGSNKKKDSFVIECKASCMSNRKSAMHAKFYLFSQVGNAPLVSMVSSANITHTNSEGSWNNLQTVVGDAAIYGSLTKYFTDMKKDKTDRNYYRTTTSGKYKLFLFPRKTKHATLATALDNVACTGAAPGYGTKDGHTIIRIATYSWTTTRMDLARKVWSMQNHGCKVDVIVNRERTSPAVRQLLSRRTKKHGSIRVYDSFYDANGDNRPSEYMHHKSMIVNGVWYGQHDAKVVYAGSQNFTGNATTDNNDIVFRIQDPQIYDKYSRNLDFIETKVRRVHW